MRARRSAAVSPNSVRCSDQEGITDPMWFEVRKSRLRLRRPKVRQEGRRPRVRVGRRRDGAALHRRARRAPTSRWRSSRPARPTCWRRTSEIPKDIPAAVQIGLHGGRRVLDVGSVNGERFAVMAGVGFDALMIRDADRGLKDTFRTGSRTCGPARSSLRGEAVRGTIGVDGASLVQGQGELRARRQRRPLIGGVESSRRAPGRRPARARR